MGFERNTGPKQNKAASRWHYKPDKRPSHIGVARFDLRPGIDQHAGGKLSFQIFSKALLSLTPSLRRLILSNWKAGSEFFHDMRPKVDRFIKCSQSIRHIN